MADAPKYPDFSQPSIMNPRYGPRIAQMLGPLIREFQRQQQFSQAFGVSPRQAIKPTPEETQRMLNVGLAFGGADITKEQKAQWEAENEAFRKERLGRKQVPYPEESARALEPGTRATWRGKSIRTANPESTMDPNAAIFAPENAPLRRGMSMHSGTSGTVVTPGTPEAGEPGMGHDHVYSKGHPDPNMVAFRRDGQDYWLWKHRDSLEVLPTEQFKAGDPVVVDKEWGDLASHGVVGNPPRGAIPSPGPEYVWVDVAEHPIPEVQRPREGHSSFDMKGVKHYAGGNWGGWLRIQDLTKKGK